MGAWASWVVSYPNTTRCLLGKPGWGWRRRKRADGRNPALHWAHAPGHVTACQLTPQTKQVGFRCHELDQGRRGPVPGIAGQGCQEPNPGGSGPTPGSRSVPQSVWLGTGSPLPVGWFHRGLRGQQRRWPRSGLQEGRPHPCAAKTMRSHCRVRDGLVPTGDPWGLQPEPPRADGVGTPHTHPKLLPLWDLWEPAAWLPPCIII